MLTVQQKAIMNLLVEFKYLRYSHIQRYMAAKYQSQSGHVERMLKQLRYMGRLEYNERFVWLTGRKADMKMIAAFDVLLDLTKGKFSYIASGAYPAFIIFSNTAHGDNEQKAGGGARTDKVYFIIKVDPWLEGQVNKYVEKLGREITVIFMLDDWKQHQLVRTNNPHHFALQDDKGKYKFYNPQ